KANAGPAQAGPQSVFGRLCQWLQFGRSTKDPGPVRDLLRDFITQHFAMPAGSVIFGTVLERRRLHTATSLSRECDVNRKTLHKLLVARGLVADDDIEGAVFDAAQGEQLAEIVKHLIGYKQLPRFLNYSRTRVDQLIEAGLIKPIDGRPPPDASQVRVIGFDRREVADFLNCLAGRAIVVEQASEGMASIADATFPGIKAVEIIQNVVAGHLSAVERLISVPGIDGLLVSPMEVKALLNKQEKLLSPRQTSIRLRLDREMMPGLLGEGSEPAILSAVDVKLRKVAGTKRMLTAKAVVEFERTYVSLCGIASETGRHFRTVMKELDEMQIKVVRRGMKPTAAVYLRSAVPWSRFSQ
ncbi:MAG: hypothetical protein Q4G26_13020, partial [Paracoccus sp. (in: a-proteobacteria)]|nr:hypothetical protein [Paracoccus sp. (in: a-proteobacteria)]